MTSHEAQLRLHEMRKRLHFVDMEMAYGNWAYPAAGVSSAQYRACKARMEAWASKERAAALEIGRGGRIRPMRNCPNPYVTD